MPQPLCGSGPAPVSNRAPESGKTCCGTRGTYGGRGRAGCRGARRSKPVRRGGEPTGLLSQAGDSLSRRVSEFSRSQEAPPHPLSPSGLDPRAKAQVAVTAVSWGSDLPHPVLPGLQALRPRSAEQASPRAGPRCVRAGEPPRRAYRTAVGRLGAHLKYNCSQGHARACTNTRSLGLSAIEKDNDPERCAFTWGPTNYKAPSPTENRSEPWTSERSPSGGPVATLPQGRGFAARLGASRVAHPPSAGAPRPLGLLPHIFVIGGDLFVSKF